MRGKQVLVVEDNEHERAILSRYLEFVGGEALAAENGKEGLRVAKEAIPDLILLDLRMPILDGWETIRQLKADPRTSQIRVIALSASKPDPSELRDAGFCGHIPKPVAPYQVLKEVERCIGRVSGGVRAGEAVRSATAPGVPTMTPVAVRQSRRQPD